MKLAVLVMIFTLEVGAVAAAELWAVDFDDVPVGRMPPGPNKTEWEKRDAGTSVLPRRTGDALLCITPTRRAAVEAAAFGLESKPLVFHCEENAQPQYGPQFFLTVPAHAGREIARFELSLDVAKNNEAQAGGFYLENVGAVNFRRDGMITANQRELARYQPDVPVHFQIIIDRQKREAWFAVDGAAALDLPWQGKGDFTFLRLDGLSPGGYAEVPAAIAFDNIRLTADFVETPLPPPGK